MNAVGAVFNATFFGMSDTELVEAALRKNLPATSRYMVYRITTHEPGDVYTKVNYEFGHGIGVWDGPKQLQ
jgi:hypothetical protein